MVLMRRPCFASSLVASISAACLLLSGGRAADPLSGRAADPVNGAGSQQRRQGGGLIFRDDFEKVDTSTWKTDFNGKTGRIVTSAADDGRDGGCLNFTVSYCDDGSCYRSEYKRPKGVDLQIGKEYWFGFTLRLPANISYKESSDPNIFHFQLHGGDNIGRAPVLGLNIHNHDSPLKWRLEVNGDDTHSSSASHSPKWSLAKDLGAVVPGEWEDFVFRVKLEYKQTGIVQAWRNGQKLVDESKIATAFNDDAPPYLKIGSYLNKPFKTSGGIRTKWWGVSYWQLKVGNASSSYDEVSTALQAKHALEVV